MMANTEEIFGLQREDGSQEQTGDCGKPSFFVGRSQRDLEGVQQLVLTHQFSGIRLEKRNSAGWLGDFSQGDISPFHS